MKQILVLFLCLAFGLNVFGQEDEIKQLVGEGVALNDQGKFNDAILKYKAALKIDKNSPIANYELAYTYLATRQYDLAIKHSKIVLKEAKGENENIKHGAYVVKGSSEDLMGKPKNAIKTYEEGISKFPASSLLNYNLGLTCYNVQDYQKAEEATIRAVQISPNHGSSHLLLSSIMLDQNQRIKAILPLYYFLMVEPSSKRTVSSYQRLLELLNMGVTRKDDKNISIILPSNDINDGYSTIETMLGFLAAAKYTEEGEKKTEYEQFASITSSVFSLLDEKELKKDFWKDFYVTKYKSLSDSTNVEAFCYFISKCMNDELVDKWISENPDKMKSLEEWMNK